MISRTHDAGAFAALVTAAVYYPPGNLGVATVVVALIANIVGAMLPDIDQASNRLWDLLPGGNYVGKVLRKILLSHRTLSHSILGMWLVYRVTEWLIPKLFNGDFVNPGIIFWSIIIGYGSHLVLDGLTEEGLPLLFPFKWKFGFPPMKHWRIRTDGFRERWIVFPLIVGYVGWLGWQHWDKLLKILLR